MNQQQRPEQKVSTITNNQFKGSDMNKQDKRSPVELHYMRRVAVKHQKKQVVLVKLTQLSTFYFKIYAALVAVLALIMFIVQIAIIVKRTPLFYVCTGFWVALFYLSCILSVYFLVDRKSYKMLVVSIVANSIGLVLSLCGLILINCFDMALYVSICIPNCANQFSYQFLNLIMIIVGSFGFIVFAAYLVMIEYFILRESRSLNIFLRNRK